MHMMVKKKI